MTGGRIDDNYSPYGLALDPDSLGLLTSTVSSQDGSIVSRSRKTNASRRATIFLHGAAGSWSTWTPLITAADRAGVPIENPVLLDLPGWGDATLTPEGERALLETLCSLVRASVEALGYTEWDLVGHSMGGFVALHMATLWPECVVSVATVSATTWTLMDAAQHPFAHFRRLPGFVMLWRVMQVLAALGAAGAGLARGIALLGLLRGAVAPLFRHPSRVSPTVIRALALEVRPRSFSAAVRMGDGYDASARWAGIDCAITALKGDRDIFARDVDFERLSDIQPESHCETIQDCGHFAHIERPFEVLAALGFAG